MKRALLVIDVQNEYVDGGLKIRHPDLGTSLPNITAAMTSASDHNVAVVVVQHVEDANAPIFARDSHGAALHPSVAGFMTQHCCAGTARDAAALGFAVEFLADATGTLDLANEAGTISAAALHESVLTTLHSGFAAVVDTGRWRSAVAADAPLHPSNLWQSTHP